MVSHDNQFMPVETPIAVPSQRSYAVGQEAGISWGRYNINTDAITAYYSGLSDLVSNGFTMFSNLQKLNLEKLKWSHKLKKDERTIDQKARFNATESGVLLFDPFEDITYDYILGNLPL